MNHDRNTIDEFIRVGTRFCQSLEAMGAPDAQSALEFSAQMNAVLARLYGIAIYLPLVDASLVGGNFNTQVAEADLENVRCNIKSLLADCDEYRVIWDPYEDAVGDAVVFARLSDDLTHVYREIKVGLLAIEAGYIEEHVIWEWRFGFWMHWGWHAVNALRVFHFLMHTREPVISSERIE